MRKKLLLCIGWFCAAKPGLAQTSSELHAEIFTVTEARGIGRFKVPQVRLADAAVARRINRCIARSIVSGEAVDTTLRLTQQLRQTALECCWDAEERRWSSGQGMTGCRYEVLLNAHGLLSLEFILESTGAYTYESTDHVTFDLRTGRQLALPDVLADPPLELTRRMHGAISRRFGEALAEITAQEDSATVEFVTERFCWDWSAKRVRFSSDPDIVKGNRASEPKPENFALTPTELRLYYEGVLNHAALNLEPDNTYRFPYGRLHPRGLLVSVAKVQSAKKKR